MFRYALKRILYSLLIMGGVLILTFVLFRLAAGDPALTVLGKNPSPQEIEEMRGILGSDKPLFWGRWRHTELYTGADFANSRVMFAGVALRGSYRALPQGVLLGQGGSVVFRRNFELPDRERFRVEINASAPLSVNGREFVPDDGVIAVEMEQSAWFAKSLFSVRPAAGSIRRRWIHSVKS